MRKSITSESFSDAVEKPIVRGAQLLDLERRLGVRVGREEAGTSEVATDQGVLGQILGVLVEDLGGQAVVAVALRERGVEQLDRPATTSIPSSIANLSPSLSS